MCRGWLEEAWMGLTGPQDSRASLRGRRETGRGVWLAAGASSRRNNGPVTAATRQPRPIILPRMSSQSSASIYPGLGSQPVPHPAPPTVPSHWQMPGSPRCPPSHSSPLHPAPHSGLNIPQFFSLLSILSAAAWPRPPPSPAALPASMRVSHQARSPPHSQRPSFLTSPTCTGSHCPGGPRGPSQSGASAEPRQSDRVRAWALEPHCLSRPLTGCETGPQFAHLLNGDVRVNHRKLLFLYFSL